MELNGDNFDEWIKYQQEIMLAEKRGEIRGMKMAYEMMVKHSE